MAYDAEARVAVLLSSCTVGDYKQQRVLCFSERERECVLAMRRTDVRGDRCDS
jgi:hypothetical protein